MTPPYYRPMNPRMRNEDEHTYSTAHKLHGAVWACTIKLINVGRLMYTSSSAAQANNKSPLTKKKSLEYYVQQMQNWHYRSRTIWAKFIIHLQGKKQQTLHALKLQGLSFMLLTKARDLNWSSSYYRAPLLATEWKLAVSRHGFQVACSEINFFLR